MDNTREHLKKIIEIHGERFTFTNVEFLHWYKEVTVKCNKHNITFDKQLGKLLFKANGEYVKFIGCKECSREKNLLDTVGFRNRLKKIFGNKYKIGKTKILNFRNTIIVECPIHGKFDSTPARLLQGKGCRLCGIINRTHNNDIFINKAIKIHGMRYDYSLVKYISSREKVKIGCPEHGFFEQRAEAHIRGQGCDKCRALNSRNSYESFIDKANMIHDFKYTYSKESYSVIDKKMDIFCPIHGLFQQRPAYHINRAQGCPECISSKGENVIRDFLIKNKIEYKREYKIPGYSYRYDFYLPKINMLIEYDGKQHFIAIPFFGGEPGLKILQKNDLIKNGLAIKFGHHLVRLDYTQFKELGTLLALDISKQWKYRYKGKFFKKELDFINYIKNIKQVDVNYKQYLTINQLQF